MNDHRHDIISVTGRQAGKNYASLIDTQKQGLFSAPPDAPAHVGVPAPVQRGLTNSKRMLVERLGWLGHGNVVTWTMHGRFSYVAVKISERWYTTATTENTVVNQIVSNTELADLLLAPESMDQQIVTNRERIVI